MISSVIHEYNFYFQIHSYKRSCNFSKEIPMVRFVNCKRKDEKGHESHMSVSPTGIQEIKKIKE